MTTLNNVGAAASADVASANPSGLAAGSKDELHPPESARSTSSARSWITDDKWSDDDDDDADADDDADEPAANNAAAGLASKAPSSRVALPVTVLGGHSVSGNELHQQVACRICDLSYIASFQFYSILYFFSYFARRFCTYVVLCSSGRFVKQKQREC